MIDKTVPTLGAAVAGIADGSTVMVGGFATSGVPLALIDALLAHGARELTIVSNHAGSGDTGLAALIAAGRVRKIVCSFPRHKESWAFDRLYNAGKLDLELVPQGTLAERIRAGGAGIPAFFTATGVGTLVAEGKEVREFGGRRYVMETALKADLSIVKAWKADEAGNLVFRKTARNFNPMMATAGKVTVAGVEEIVPAGALDPDFIHTPGIYVHRLVAGKFQKRIEQRTTRAREA